MRKKSIIVLLFLITLSSIILVNFGMKTTAEECKDCNKEWREVLELVGIMYEELIDGEWQVNEFDFG